MDDPFEIPSAFDRRREGVCAVDIDAIDFLGRGDG